MNAVIFIMSLFCISCMQPIQLEANEMREVKETEFIALYLADRPYADHWKYAGNRKGKLVLEHWQIIPKGSALKLEGTVFCRESSVDMSILSLKQKEISYGKLPWEVGAKH